MDNAKIIRNAINVVTILLSAFSAYLEGIAPPEDTGTAVAVGMAAISSIFALLLINALAKGRTSASRIHWIVTAIVLFVAAVGMYYVYFRTVESTTFACPPKNKVTIIGTLTPEAESRFRNEFGNDLCREIRAAGGMQNYRLLSQDDSISQARMRLRMYYIIFVLLLLSSIFCLTDGVFGSRSAAGRPKTKHPTPQAQGKGTADRDSGNEEGGASPG